MEFDIVVDREQFVSRILSPISRVSTKAILTLEGNRVFAIANFSNANTGQMFLLSDMKMENSIDEPSSMVLNGVGKMITALSAVKSKMVSIRYDGTGLEYKSKSVSFRIRLSSETISVPFKKEKVLSLDVTGQINVDDDKLKEFSRLLSGFPNLNQMSISLDDEGHVVFGNGDRDGVTDEKMSYVISECVNGEIPNDFTVYNYIFRSSSLSSLGRIYIKLGSAFCMVCSANGSSKEDGEIRYLLPKLKMKAR